MGREGDSWEYRLMKLVRIKRMVNRNALHVLFLGNTLVIKFKFT